MEVFCSFSPSSNPFPSTCQSKGFFNLPHSEQVFLMLWGLQGNIRRNQGGGDSRKQRKKILNQKNRQPLLRAFYPWAQHRQHYRSEGTKAPKLHKHLQIILSKLLLTIKLQRLGDYQMFAVVLYQMQIHSTRNKLSNNAAYVLFKIHLPLNKCSVIKVITFYFKLFFFKEVAPICC